MTKKTILYGTIAAGLLVGLVSANTFANAESPHEEDSQLFELIMELETQIISLQTQLMTIQLVPGPQGPPGPPGPSTTYIMYDTGKDGTDSAGNTILEVECLPGDIATGGGAGPLGGYLVTSRPIPSHGNPAQPSAFPPTGWSAIIKNSSAGDVWVVCLDEP